MQVINAAPLESPVTRCSSSANSRSPTPGAWFTSQRVNRAIVIPDVGLAALS